MINPTTKEGRDVAGVSPDGDAETPAEAGAYSFDSGQSAVAVEAVDTAMSDGGDVLHAALVIGRAEDLGDIDGAGPLRRELSRALTYALDLAPLDGDPGCELKTDGYALHPAVRDVPEPVVQLWRAVAAGVTHQAAIAHFEDLLWCRRDGNPGTHASRAARAYLDLGTSPEVGVSCATYLVRAWTIARQIRSADLDSQIRARMAVVASAVLDTNPGERPGVLLPVLGALAQGPIRVKKVVSTDPINVDDLLARASDTCARGRHATTVARFRRGRTQDPAAHQRIARDEVEAYFREADAATQPMVRMLLLQNAARVAAARGLRDLERVAATAMQNINPADIQWHVVRTSSRLPDYIVEGMLRGYTSGPDWHDGMDCFLTSECPTGDIADLRATAAATRSPLSQMLPPVLVSGGLPKATADTAQEFEKHEMSFAARVQAENMGRFMAAGLDRIAERYGVPEEGDLVTYLVSRGGGDAALARSVAKALRHYWNRDYESCIHVATPKFEAAARSLLIEFDEGIYRAEADKTPGGYPGLYVLLNRLENAALDESWAYFFGWLLGGPWGANLRNDVAHGLPTPMTANYAALVLRAVCALGVVAGPVANSHLPIADRRARDELVNALTDLSIDAGPAANLLGRLAAVFDRLAWRLRVFRLRRMTTPRHGDRNRDDQTSA
jgi:hypothetical protein